MTKAFFKIILFFLLSLQYSIAQSEQEIAPPFNIKTISFVQNSKNTVPIFQLGDTFQLQFDDLYGNEADYYYEIIHCDYNWIPSDIPRSDYLIGFQNQRILDYSNSFNTLQMYSHYQLTLPNYQTQLRISGNYILKILNEDKEVVFTRKFILHEELASVPIQVRRAKKVSDMDYMQNLEFVVKSQVIPFLNPTKNLKITILQNGRFDSAITNLPPQYTLGNDMVYKYTTETQFWAGNEYLYFDSNDIKNANNNIARVEGDKEIYKTFLYTNSAKANFPYSTSQDDNGNFVVRNYKATNNAIESDYSWVYFSLSAPAFMQNKSIYVTGMFNNYSKTPEYKMEYNPQTKLFEKAILTKQGFTNYEYTIVDSQGRIDNKNAIDGNFYQTENNYTVLVYYRADSSRYDRVIGKGTANSLDLFN